MQDRAWQVATRIRNPFESQVGFRHLRRELQRLLKVLFRLAQLVFREQDVTRLVVRSRVVGIQFQFRGKFGERFFRASTPPLNVPDREVYGL